MSTAADSPARPAPTTRTRTLLAVAGAGLAPVVLWLAGRAAGAEFTVTMGGQAPMTIGVPAVIATAFAASLAGLGAVALLNRVSRRPRRSWTVVASVALVLSLTGPATVEADTATRALLVSMHVAVAAVLIPGLRRAAARSRP